MCRDMPGASTRSLARLLYSEFEDHYNSCDSARTVIRKVRGQTEGNYTDQQSYSKRENHMLEIPEPKKHFGDWKPQRLKARKVLVLSDIHLPYHDKAALELAVKHGLDEGVDAVLFNGDLMDYYGISRWNKDPRQRDFKSEIEVGREMLHFFRETFKGCQLWWKLGNHEERWESYMYNHAPDLLGIEEFEIRHWSHADRHNVKVIGDMQPVQINKLNVLHGHEYRFSISNPVNPARGIYLRAKVPTLMGHLHQTSEHTESDLNAKMTTCWSSGCLCDLRPCYSPLNKWNHGFAVVDTTGEDDYAVHNHRIYRGRIL